jgi:hypothetical protein
MPVVHNGKSRAGKGRGRRANSWCSWCVLASVIAVSTTVLVRIDLQTVICQEPSVSRGNVAGTKLQQPADASVTIWWRQFKQA